MEAKEWTAAVVGAGAIAGHHLKAIGETDGLTACAVADIDRSRAEAVAARFGIRAYGSAEEMIEREAPDIVAISLPHDLHRRMAVFAAERGCHLMLEKPMALNLDECDDIMAAAKRAGIRLLVGHTQQYMAHNLEAKRLLRSGAIGRLVMIHDVRHADYFAASRPDWFLRKEKSGGGILANLGVHSIDKIQWLTDSAVSSVSASTSYHGPRGNVEGSGIVYLKLDNGIPAAIVQSGYPGAQRNETEIIGTEGMMKLATGHGLWISRGGAYEQAEIADPADPFVLQYEDLLQAIREDRETGCPGAYGRQVVAVMEAVYRAAETGREQQVRLPAG